MSKQNEICKNCMNWETPDPYMQPKQRNGYCYIFDKMTTPTHGTKCTAFKCWPGDLDESKPNPPNTRTDTRAAAETVERKTT